MPSLANRAKLEFFLERVKDEQPRRLAVQWESRENDETDLTYYQRLLTAKRPLAYRKGGGAFLGFRDGQVKQQPRLWKLQGVPHLWGEDELLTILQESRATNIEIISGPQRRKGGFWKVKMLCPFDDGTGTHCLQADDETVILLTHFVSPHTRSRPVSKPLLPGSLRAPRATPAKDLADSLPEVPPTVPDSPDGEDGKTNTQMASQAEHNEMELDKEKKRKSDEASSETHAAKLSKKQQPFELVECGGGRCLWLQLHCCWHGLKPWQRQEKNPPGGSQSWSPTRVLLNTYLENKGWFARHFVPNQGTEVICGGPIPATWSEYVEAVLRPTFWCDALCLLGLARRLKQKFIVVMYNPTTAQWEKRAVLGNSKNIIVLALQDNHYRLVLPTNDHPLPEEWISAPEDLDLGCIDLTGGMAPSRASWIPATSPSKARPSWIPSTSSGGTTSGPSAAPKSASTKSRKIIGAAKNHSSLPKFPASTNSRVWWKCPACDE